jgi:hypothetical protein
VLPAGNQGPSCRTVLTPASLMRTMGVSATGRDGSAAVFSSRGPGQAVWGRLQATQFPLEKPDWVAPGEGVRAAHSDHDHAYLYFSGTHLAAAATAGAVALVLSAAPSASYADVHEWLRATAMPPPTAPAVGAEPTICYTPGANAYVCCRPIGALGTGACVSVDS